MRYNEHQVQPEEGKKKEEKPREMVKPGKYSSEELMSTKKRPLLGGNYNGRS